MYTKTLSGSILFLFALTACQQNSSPAAPNNTAKPASTVSAGNVSIPEVKAKYYDGTGKVTKINMDIGSVELDHEEIKDLMPKMVMEFYVADKSQLKDLKIGDQVDFVLEDKGGAEKIYSIKKSQVRK